MVAIDKTGTLTTGEMAVLEVVGGDDVLARAAAVERFSEHPVADAIATRAGSEAGSASSFERHAGRGVSGEVDGERVVVGRRDLLGEHGMTVDEGLADRAAAARRAGDVPALVGWDGAARGVIVTGDRPRAGWAAVVDELADGREVVVITGDSREATAPFDGHPGVSDVFAGVPPEAKAAVVDRLRARGRVAMVGDGTNDASALAAADVGIAIERGAALASDAADVVVTTDDLGAVTSVFELTRAARRRVRWNLAWAFGYNAVAVPLALAGLLNPLLAAVAMAGSSLLVVANSSRPLLGEDDTARGTGTELAGEAGVDGPGTSTPDVLPGPDPTE